MKVSLVFIRDRRFFSNPSTKFMNRRKKDPYPGDKKHYIFGEPPLGIMYISAVLKKAGHEVSMIDQCHPEYSDEKFVDSLTKSSPDMVGISFLSNMCYPAALTLSRKIKMALPSTKIVYGGVFSTINADKIIASEQSVDIVVRGEGEYIIQKLVENLDRPGDIPSITFKSRTGEVVETPPAQELGDIDAIPFPDREGLDINYVASLPLDIPGVIWDLPYTTIVTSRGCPFACTYCNCPTFSNRKCRLRSAANVLKELEEIERLGYRAFSFLDDNFFLNPGRVAEICRGMGQLRHPFKWACQGRVDPMGNGVFRKLARAGCEMVMFGIESGSQRILDNMNKKTKLSDVEETVNRAKESGINLIHGFFIVGSPGETAAELKQSFDFADRVPITSFGFNSLIVFRGTPLWKDAVSRGLIDEDKDWDKIFRVHEIYPDAIDSKTLFKIRSDSIMRLIIRKVTMHPLKAIKIFRRFIKCMSIGDIYRLLTSSKSNYTPDKNVCQQGISADSLPPRKAVTHRTKMLKGHEKIFSALSKE